MAGDEDKSSKTEEPTYKRLRDAHEKGNFARAEEIGVVLGLAAAFAVLVLYGKDAAISIRRMAVWMFSHCGEIEITPSLVVDQAWAGLGYMGGLLAPLLGAALVAALLAGGLQSGFRPTPKAFGVKFEKLHPVNGLKQKYSGQALANFAFNLLKLFVVAGVVYEGFERLSHDPIFFTVVEPERIPQFMLSSTLTMLAFLIFGLGAIGGLHFLFQKHRTRQSLRMSKQEIKDEHRQQEGDPHMKQMRRQMARRFAQRQMMTEVPGADVVIVNPTHYAVALRYDRQRHAAPIVLAKGMNLVAGRIREIAGQHAVPIIENKPVARALFKVGEPGREIPPALYQAVAEILSLVYRLKRRGLVRGRMENV
ncbi:flagellar biosynthesis protein FlhB [Ruficoccus amylovorans]|uniref:Flagellar biosynthesis protein FlhB n=1 Tax=Ruficoccus amylovorans TaxID=1804625 RepID=A0A842HF23_9BACT|nr:flagellar type III secretion system protein FlhB [Ruficoccus amylovorans]MBC2595022.1 flagellar biosynthesis protein FlhB [Ruficoccus amylovorans]